VFNYFENTGTANSPAFAVVSGPGNPLDTFDVGSYSAPAFADLDDDGNVDLFSGEWSGRIMYFVPEPEPGVLTAASIATVGWLARRRRAGGGQEQ